MGTSIKEFRRRCRLRSRERRHGDKTTGKFCTYAFNYGMNLLPMFYQQTKDWDFNGTQYSSVYFYTNLSRLPYSTMMERIATATIRQQLSSNFDVVYLELFKYKYATFDGCCVVEKDGVRTLLLIEIKGYNDTNVSVNMSKLESVGDLTHTSSSMCQFMLSRSKVLTLAQEYMNDSSKHLIEGCRTVGIMIVNIGQCKTQHGRLSVKAVVTLDGQEQQLVKGTRKGCSGTFKVALYE